MGDDLPDNLNTKENEMTENAPLPVKGYTAQSDWKVALANEGKELEERYLRWLDKLAKMPTADRPGDPPSIDARCIAEARTCIQTGAMWAIRSIFQPQRISLPVDN